MGNCRGPVGLLRGGADKIQTIREEECCPKLNGHEDGLRVTLVPRLAGVPASRRTGRRRLIIHDGPLVSDRGNSDEVEKTEMLHLRPRVNREHAAMKGSGSVVRPDAPWTPTAAAALCFADAGHRLRRSTLIGTNRRYWTTEATVRVMKEPQRRPVRPRRVKPDTS